MKRILSKCPNCDSELKITTLSCDACGLELKGSFERSVFDKLSKENYRFLIEFLRCQGNLKELQSALGISYPLAKRRLAELLAELQIEQEAVCENEKEWEIDEMSKKASEIIKKKFSECGGVANIETARGKIFKVEANNEFIGSATALHNVTYEYRVFDYITEVMIENGGEARKGMGRNARVGEPGCTNDTIVGRIGKKYYHKEDGEYTFDPVFILVAIMEWAGIVNNKRGYVEFTEEYKKIMGWY